METKTEQLTQKQLKELQEHIAPSVAIFRSVLFLIALFLVGALLYLILGKVFRFSPLLWIAPTIVFGYLLYIKAGKWTGGKKLREGIKIDLQNGICNHFIVKPINVIEFTEEEDEGPSYLIETEDSHALLLAGQYLVSYKWKKFPWDKFAIMEAPLSKIFFGLKKLGEPISVSDHRPPLAYSLLKQVGSFNSNYVLLSTEELELFKSNQALKSNEGTCAR